MTAGVVRKAALGVEKAAVVMAKASKVVVEKVAAESGAAATGAVALAVEVMEAPMAVVTERGAIIRVWPGGNLGVAATGVAATGVAEAAAAGKVAEEWAVAVAPQAVQVKAVAAGRVVQMEGAAVQMGYH